MRIRKDQPGGTSKWLLIARLAVSRAISTGFWSPRACAGRHRDHGQSQQPQERQRAQGHRRWLARRCFTAHLTAPTLHQSNTPSRNSRRYGERPPSKRSTPCGTGFSICSRSAAQTDAKTSSPLSGMTRFQANLISPLHLFHENLAPTIRIYFTVHLIA
jgi:hypothetical protein